MFDKLRKKVNETCEKLKYTVHKDDAQKPVKIVKVKSEIDPTPIQATIFIHKLKKAQ